MKKSILLAFMAAMFSISAFAKSEIVSNPVKKQVVESNEVQPAKAASAPMRLILVTIETTCGETQSFYFQPAPGATLEDIEYDLGLEATGWNMILCHTYFDDWVFIWS